MTLPVHPLTGLQAIGIGKRGPIWPVIGGAPDEGEQSGGEDEGGEEQGEIEAPAANNWWQFSDKEAAEAWANNLVTKRLTRDRKSNLEPLQQTNATLEAELERLRPLAEKAMTADEKREAEFAAAQQELEELRQFKTQAARTATINEVAAEVGLPASLRSFITADGTDADAVREQATTLLNAMSDGGSNTGKRTPTPKAPKGDEVPAGGQASSGGGGNNGEPSDEEMVQRILAKTAEIRKNGGFSV